MIGAEAVRKRDAVSPADDDAVPRDWPLPDPTFEACVYVLRRIIRLERRKEVRRGGRAQPVSEQRPARADVECPPVPTGDVETRLVKGERGADTRPTDESRPRRAQGERVDWD